MDIDQAKKLKYGQKVRCPADNGDPPYVGTVRTETEIIAGSSVEKNLDGVEYIWIEVQGLKHKSVWPSNRLGSM
jgi:hypothetical protein